MEMQAIQSKQASMSSGCIVANPSLSQIFASEIVQHAVGCLSNPG